MKKKIEIIAKYVISFLTLLVIVSIFFALYGLFQIAILDKSYANYFGYGLFEVESGSMEPTIKVKDMVIVKKTNKIEKNDIITYELDKSFITHRVVKVEKNKVITKGDANNHDDKTIPRKNVVGKVVKICPKFGVWKKILLSPIVLIAVALAMLLFSVGFSYEDKKLVIKMRGKKKKHKEAEKDEEKEQDNIVIENGEKENIEPDDKEEEKTAEETETKKEIKVKIKWIDDDNRDGIRPKKVIVKLKKNDEVIKEQEVLAQDNWEYTFSDLTEDYEIEQRDVDGYSKSINNNTITNTHNSKKVNISGEIKWKDDNNKNNKRPQSVKIKLMKGQELVEEKEITKKDKWKYTFINLYKCEKGKEIKYTVDEDQIENYIKNINDNNITNTLN